MAFHNLFQTMRHIYLIALGRDIMVEAEEKYIREKGGEWNEDFANEDLVWHPMFNAFNNALPEEKEKIEQLLDKHFPFLIPYFDFASKDEYYKKKQFDKLKIIKHLSQVLRNFRNFYSHYKLDATDTQYNNVKNNMILLTKGLQNAFVGAKRIVKERFAYTDGEMICTEQYKWNSRIKKNEERKGFLYKTDIKNRLTPFGLLFFTSLFLEKKYSKIFADKIHCIKKEDQAVICEMLAVYRIKLKINKLSIVKPDNLIALDILTELRKCPKELFELFAPEDQKQFRILAENSDAEQDVLMVRHSDRFTELVLKYIDSKKLFQDVRFQVSLGKYFFKFYDKKCIDAESANRVRALSKNIHGFGRIDEIESLRQNQWKDLIRDYDNIHKNSAEEKPYITDFHAQYIINKNKIGIRILENTGRISIPELTNEGAQNLAPTCWLSTYDLPALVFLMHLTSAQKVETVIKETVEKYNHLFTDIRDGILLPCGNEQDAEQILQNQYGGIKLKDIPQDMQNYLCGKTPNTQQLFAEKTKQLIDDLVEQTQYKLDRLEKDLKQIKDGKSNKLGKRNYVVLKPGRLASFLAKDMMFFQPNNAQNSNKLTSLNFNVLQAVIATYSSIEQVGDLERTLRSAHLLGNLGNGSYNPIVSSMWNPKKLPQNTIEFYKMYLKARLSYLEKCSKVKDFNTLPFVFPQRMKWQERDADYCKAKAGRYLRETYQGTEYDKSLALPSGLFENAIRKALQNIPEMQDLANDASKNTAYLIYAYFMRKMKDDAQPFYSYNRCYPIFNALYRTKDKRQAVKVLKSADEIRDLLRSGNNPNSLKMAIQKYVVRCKDNRQEEENRLSSLLKNLKNNETLLKRIKIQDMMLFLIAKKILGEGYFDQLQQQAFDEIKLKSVLDTKTLSKRRRMSVTLSTKCGDKEIFKENLALKDYARFYRVLNDRRLKDLLELLDANKINYDDIMKEFEGYDKVHPDILKGIFSYERQFYGNNVTNYQDFPAMIQKDSLYDSKERYLLIGIRNAFSHYNYPSRECIKEKNQVALPKKAIAISEEFTSKINKRWQIE
ncbi:MAG: type VI-B CRISPR-associated RNA-guided ribonuclease Cas13b [Bacteroidales bacterium]|nr:type VI-B CRISPR-associated RNA-guided ribonuclease Cas13b [Bacteroidales bacterium]